MKDQGGMKALQLSHEEKTKNNQNGSNVYEVKLTKFVIVNAMQAYCNRKHFSYMVVAIFTMLW